MRNKETRYCYTEEERVDAIASAGPSRNTASRDWVRSPGEFSHFIGEDIRLDPVDLDGEHQLDDMLAFFMGKNTPDRQRFIIDNLRVEKDPDAEKVETETTEAA